MSAALKELAALNRRKAAEYQKKNFANIEDRVNGLPERFTGHKSAPESMPLELDAEDDQAAGVLTPTDLANIQQIVADALAGQPDDSSDDSGDSVQTDAVAKSLLHKDLQQKLTDYCDNNLLPNWGRDAANNREATQKAFGNVNPFALTDAIAIRQTFGRG